MSQKPRSQSGAGARPMSARQAAAAAEMRQTEQTGQATAGEGEAATVNGTNGTRCGATFRTLSKVLGYAPSTLWRNVNEGRPFMYGVRLTVTREQRFDRVALVCVARHERGWSIRRIASVMGRGRSTIARDLDSLARHHACEPDAIAWAHKHLAIQRAEAQRAKIETEGRR